MRDELYVKFSFKAWMGMSRQALIYIYHISGNGEFENLTISDNGGSCHVDGAKYIKALKKFRSNKNN